MSEQTRRPRAGAGNAAVAEPEITLPLSETTLGNPDPDDDDPDGVDLIGGTADEPEGDDTGDEDEEAGDESDESDESASALATAEAEAAEARRAADRQALMEEARADVRREDAARAEEAATAQRQERVKGSYASTVRTIDAGLKNLTVAIPTDEGPIEVRLGDLVSAEQLQAIVFDHLNAYNGDVHQAQAIEVYSGLGRAALAKLPKEVGEKFAADFTNKPIEDWLAGWGESYAEHSAWGKHQALERTAHGKAERAAGIRQGKGMDPEVPSQEGTTGRAPRKTWPQLQAGYGQGKLTAAEEQEYLRQDKERQKNK